MSGETMTLARFVSALEFDHLPIEVVERTRLLVMDHFGIALRARHAADLNPSICCALEALGLSSGQSSVIGDSAGYAPPVAAFYNGNLAHSLDFDDTHAEGSLHSSTPIVPAAILFDLANGGDKDWGRYPPYRELGYDASVVGCLLYGTVLGLGQLVITEHGRTGFKARK